MKGREGGLREPDVHGSAVKCCDANVCSFQVIIAGEGRGSACEIDRLISGARIFYPSLSQGAERAAHSSKEVLGCKC